MEHVRSYLMDECEVIASGRERSPTIISPQRWRHRRATENKPAWARTISPRTRLLNYSLAPCPLRPLRVPSDVCAAGTHIWPILLKKSHLGMETSYPLLLRPEPLELRLL